MTSSNLEKTRLLSANTLVTANPRVARTRKLKDVLQCVWPGAKKTNKIKKRWFSSVKEEERAVMEGMDIRTVDVSNDGVAKANLVSNVKIAITPFVQAGPAVHVLDGSGKTHPARQHSAEDVFQLVVRGLGEGDAGEQEDQDDTDCTGKQVRGVDEGGLPRDRSTAVDVEKTPAQNTVEGTQRKIEAFVTGPASKPTSEAEHPLQQAVNSFDMALGELNQLVHLIDLARAGEFMALERVTPNDDSQTRAMPDPPARASDGALREGLVKMARLKNTQLKGAADRLRQRAKRLRKTTEVQRVFQQGVVHLRKKWRVVAPNHGKVDVPLQVGEPVAVDCSFGSAGGQPVPSTQAIGTRHRHPWLFQVVVGAAGRLVEEPLVGECRRTFEVQLISAVTGLRETSLRVSFANRTFKRGRRSTYAEGAAQKGASTCGDGDNAGQQLDKLEESIARLHHSVFWEEVFEAVKAEALLKGRNGWLAYLNAGSDGRSTFFQQPANLPHVVANRAPGTRRESVGNSTQGVFNGEQSSGVKVVHVMDDEVMMRMNSRYLMRFRSTPDKTQPRSASKTQFARSSCHVDRTSVEEQKLEETENESLLGLSKLALLYGGSLMRHNQQTELCRDIGGRHGSATSDGSASSGARFARPAQPASQSSLWGPVGGVLRHQLFCKKVVRVLADIALNLRRIGLPIKVQWTSLETTYPRSSLNVTLGSCFHFRASLNEESRAVVSALPGLQNHADQRSVVLRSAPDLQQFLLGEVCRQVVLTFGDMAAAWKSRDSERCHFNINLAPAIVYLVDKAADGGAGNDSSWKVRVCVKKEVGVRIACSRWSWIPVLGFRGNVNDVQEPGSSHEELAAVGSPRSDFEGEDDVSEEAWKKLKGSNLFEKFSSFLALRYPSLETHTS